MSNYNNDTRSTGYHWWSRIIAIVLAIILAVMWFTGRGPFNTSSANCCGASAAAPVAAAVAPAVVAAVAAPVVAGSVTALFENGKITLKGEVGTEAEKAKLLADAKAAYGADNVIDALTVKAGVGPLGAVTLTGQVPSEADKTARGDAASKLFAPAKVDNQLTVVAPAANAACPADALKAKVGFATGSSQLSAAGKKALNAMVGCLPKGGAVVGHTDNVGNAASNQALSERRAKSVVAYLSGKGVAAASLSATGKGDTDPAADNKTVEGRAANRRMEITPK
jgi:OmpA-OmpF porin, OOP family